MEKKNLTHCRIRALKYFSGVFHWRQQTPTQAKDHLSPAVECSFTLVIYLFIFAHFRLCTSASHHRRANRTVRLVKSPCWLASVTESSSFDKRGSINTCRAPRLCIIFKLFSVKKRKKKT